MRSGKNIRCQCTSLSGHPVDDYVVKAFFEDLSPMELDVYAQTLSAGDREQEQVRRAHQQQFARLRY